MNVPRPDLQGIHHVTAIAGDPQRNLDFYLRFLGLRLVKRTVNFDDPGTYHFYYGDETGQPGTILTFFPWIGARRGRHGTGQITTTSFAVPPGSLGFWSERARSFSVESASAPDRFGSPALRLTDPDGLSLELVETAGLTRGAETLDIPGDFAISKIGGAVMTQHDPDAAARLLTEIMGFRAAGESNGVFRFQTTAGSTIDVLADPGAPRASDGAGAVHHIAFRTSSDEDQLKWHDSLIELDFEVSPVMDRQYFHSIYFRESGGVLFEIATDLPGFLVDESADELGSSLKLPPEYEPMRQRIEGSLPPITVPVAGLLTERY